MLLKCGCNPHLDGSTWILFFSPLPLLATPSIFNWEAHEYSLARESIFVCDFEQPNIENYKCSSWLQYTKREEDFGFIDSRFP